VHPVVGKGTPWRGESPGRAVPSDPPRQEGDGGVPAKAGAEVEHSGAR
jgi:hypothetical protein